MYVVTIIHTSQGGVYMESKEAREYKEFMFNEENSMNCENCPENHGFSAWPENRLPCGQFHCWVDLHNK